jgi:glycosyltransferase involved in cell wall biosynthesis
MKILLATDAWHPQVNGVVTTLSCMRDMLVQDGHEVLVLQPGQFRTIPLPTYREIRLAIFFRNKLKKLIHAFQPDIVHIATEGPVGLATRKYCLKHGLKFTTSFHTDFASYVKLRFPFIKRSLVWSYLRRFHAPAVRTLVPTDSQRNELLKHGMKNVYIWSRGVDTNIFKPSEDEGLYRLLPKPIFTYAGRIAIEKNLTAFLDLDLPGTKVLIGDGPDLEYLKEEYPEVVFLGFKFREEMARLLAAADAFVFPSKTDTFGIVMLEAMACGLPVAAYPVKGPLDVVQNGVTGFLSDRLDEAALRSLKIDPGACIEFAKANSWERVYAQFLGYLEFNTKVNQGKDNRSLPRMTSRAQTQTHH